MKIDRTYSPPTQRTVKPSFTARLTAAFAAFLLFSAWGGEAFSQSTATKVISAPPAPQRALPPSARAARDPNALSKSTPQALALVDQVLHRLAHGQAFDCEIRQRVRAAGRESLGVGTYIQVGGGTGQFSMQVSMHDGDGKHTLQQISDGRLAYTRTDIGGRISLTRVDVGSLDEGARVLRRTHQIKPSMLVGGPSEMLDTIRRDYNLRLGKSELDGQALLVLIGTLKPLRKQEIAPRGDLPELLPTQVNLMIAAEDHPKTGFGKGLPVRIEHRSAPVTPSATTVPKNEDVPRATQTGKVVQKAVAQGRLISLIEFYSIRPVTPPPIQRFRFENQDASVTFVNETRRYEDRFDIRVSAKERAKYRY